MAKLLLVSDECIQRVAGALKNESKDEESNVNLEKISSHLRDNGVIVMENDSDVDHTLEDNFVDESSDGGGIKKWTGLGSREILNDCERLLTNCSASKNKDAPEPEASTVLGRLQDAALNSEGENETFAKDEDYGLLGTCIMLSKEKRISCNSQEKELCSCNATLDVECDGFSACKGPKDQMLESLASATVQDRDTLVQVCQGTEQSEVLASELVGTVPSYFEEQTIENYEPLHLVLTDVSSSCNPSPATVVECPNLDSDSVRNSSQNTRSAEALTFLHESFSRVERDSDIQNHCTDIGSLSRVAHDSSVELSSPLPNNVAMSQVAVGATDVANPSVLQLGVDADIVHGSNTPFLIVDPLDNALERIVKETNHLEQSCKDEVSRLKFEYEKEIQEIIIQTESKYDTRIKAVKADITLKKKDHQKNQNKVFVNKVLANAFHIHTASPRMLQDATSGLWRQQPHQQLLQQLLQLPPPQSSACQPPSCLGISSPTLHTGQHLLVPGSTSHITCQNIAPPDQAVQYPVALHGISTSRPPANSAANLHPVGQSVSPALRPYAFQSAGASSIRPATLLATSPSPPSQLQSSWPIHPLPLAVPQQPVRWPVSVSPYQNHAAPGNTLTALHNPSLSALDLLADRDHQPFHTPWNHTSHLPDIGSTFGPLDSSYLESLGDVQAGNPDTLLFHRG